MNSITHRGQPQASSEFFYPPARFEKAANASRPRLHTLLIPFHPSALNLLNRAALAPRTCFRPALCSRAGSLLPGAEAADSLPRAARAVIASRQGPVRVTMAVLLSHITE